MMADLFARRGSMKDLLGDVPSTDKTVRQMIRPANPATSSEAAASVLPKLKAIQQVVMGHMLRAKSGGLTDLDLEVLCDNHGSTFRTRRSELVDLGLIRDSGRTERQKGRNRTVWVATAFYIPPTGADHVMNKENLLKLADLLESDAANPEGMKFDLNTVAHRDGEGCFDKPVHKPQLLKADCNTVGCAIGLACVSGAFDGLSLECIRTGANCGIHTIVPTHPEVDSAGMFPAQRFNKVVSHVFGLSDEETHFLFMPSAYMSSFFKGAVGERAVAARIRDFVASGGVIPAC